MDELSGCCRQPDICMRRATGGSVGSPPVQLPTPIAAFATWAVFRLA